MEIIDTFITRRERVRNKIFMEIKENENKDYFILQPKS